MILKEFAKKYHLDPQELLDLLIFEKFPIQSIEDEIDDRLLKYLLEYTNKKNKFTKNKKNYQENKYNSYSRFNKPTEKKEQLVLLNKSYSIAECMTETKLLASQFISFFLKRKKLYSINSILSQEEVKEFAAENNIAIIEKKEILINESTQKTIDKKSIGSNVDISNTEMRPPVVVVVGHVDHGKTTLLDTIRKKHVAKSEKGGITQHVGAYQVTWHNKEITFLDTPGHEAFTALRMRGITIADIAILVVAADEGIKPQTIESIRMLKELKVQIILALTKIDRDENANYDNIFQKMTSYDLIPEVWGGNIPVVKISAIKNIGIEELLETIVLLSDITDLKIKTNVPAIGYILETNMSKGKGIVATILLQEGRLKIGDGFVVQSTWGKVNTIIDSHGKAIKEALPGCPCIISGFSSFPKVGAYLQQSDLKLAKKQAEEYALSENKKNDSQNIFLNNKKPYNIIIKTDVFSSLQAIEKSIQVLQQDQNATYCPVVISQEVGEVNENDINYAINCHSAIYLFNIKKTTQNDLLQLIERHHIKIYSFDVIYHLLEHIEKEINEDKHKELVLKKIGDLLIIKIFQIKNFGLVIGFKVVQGIAKLNAPVLIYRNKLLIGKGTIKTLQKDKNAIKELTKGNEGAMSVLGYSDFVDGDSIEVMTTE